MSFLYLTFLAPLAGFLLLAFSRGRLGENAAAIIGAGSVGGRLEAQGLGVRCSARGRTIAPVRKGTPVARRGRLAG